MIIVVPDTNALFGARWMSSVSGKKLLSLAETGACLVLLPEVVVDELERQYSDTVDEARKKAMSGLNLIRDDVDLGVVEAAFEKRVNEIAGGRAALVVRKGVSTAATPNDIARDLVKRDLARRRPFLETEQDKKKKSFGFRDAVIWETILAYLQEDGSDASIHFVTKDRGFTGKSAGKAVLHPHLLEDLDHLGIDANRVAVVDTLENVVGIVETAVTEAAAEKAAKEAAMAPSALALHTAAEARVRATNAARRAGLVRVATHALESLINKEITEEIGYGGDYQRPDFVRFDFPSAMETAMIVAIDLESDFEFDAPNGDIVTGRADVVLSIDGNTYKGDFFGEDDDELLLVGELNDHYFETSTSVRAKAVIEIDTEHGPEELEVASVVLEDNPHPPRPFVLAGTESDVEIDPELSPKVSPEMDPDPGEPDLSE